VIGEESYALAEKLQELSFNAAPGILSEQYPPVKRKTYWKKILRIFLTLVTPL